MKSTLIQKLLTLLKLELRQLLLEQPSQLSQQLLFHLYSPSLSLLLILRAGPNLVMCGGKILNEASMTPERFHKLSSFLGSTTLLHSLS